MTEIGQYLPKLLSKQEPISAVCKSGRVGSETLKSTGDLCKL